MNFNNFTIKSQEAIQEAVNLVKSPIKTNNEQRTSAKTAKINEVFSPIPKKFINSIFPESSIISFGNPCVSIPTPTKIRRANNAQSNSVLL